MDINISNTKKVNVDREAVTTVYMHYKENILPIVVIFACILILFFVIVPEFKQFLVSQEQLKTETAKLQVLKNNYNFLSSLDEAEIETDYSTLSRALPANKDFVGIMNAISIASQKTGVSVGDFDFSLGNLDKTTVEAVYPTIKININLIGNPQLVAKFVTELYKTAPVSEIVTIKASGNVATLEIRFYYKPVPPLNISDEAPVVPYSQQTAALIREISSWNNVSTDALLPFLPLASGAALQDFNSSSSAGSNSSPF
jgi:Tfp pilus assembly protein PilO